MAQFIRILLPIIPKNFNEIYLKGYVTASDPQAVTIYITKYSCNKFLSEVSNEQIENIIYGYCGHSQIKQLNKYPNHLIIKRQFMQIDQLVINGKNVYLRNNCIIMLYDYNKLRDSEIISESDDYISKLQVLIQDECEITKNNTNYESSYKNPQWLASSMLLQYIYSYYKLIIWLIYSIKKDKKVSIRQGNMILAVVVDLILGYIVLQLLSQDLKDISPFLMGMLEKLINLLHSLLKWLMGAPAGLKLNNAFNKMLGKYFSYHVQLWWVFLDVSGEKLDIILQIYHYLGYLGLTFQTAVISDMVCIATFHSYCIYVYAARLFNIQISGLIALLRLFVGRKFNPLRGGIDSCEYTNQELFVGTVAFTILLLLLPTTAMYYIVFTLFRVLSLMLQYTLAQLIYFVQTLPLYVCSLWLCHSPKVAGNIFIEVLDTEKELPLVLQVKLFNKSVYELVNNFKPPVKVLKQVEWTNLLSNILNGKQIV